MMRIRSQAMLAFVVTALASCPSARADVNLVTNGSFETGDFTGWTQFGNTQLSGVTGTFLGVSAEDGSFQAYFGPENSMGGISQNIPTVAGDSYNIDFYLYNFGGTPSEYKVEFGSTVLTDVVNPPAFPYTLFQFNATATSNITTLTAFGFVQNPNYFLLDNVSVTETSIAAVPEPSTLAIGGVSGLLALGYGLRRRRQSARTRTTG